MLFRPPPVGNDQTRRDVESMLDWKTIWVWTLLLAASPVPPICAGQTLAPVHALADDTQSSGGGHATASSTQKPGGDDEQLTMFPHSETAPWFVAGQAN